MSTKAERTARKKRITQLASADRHGISPKEAELALAKANRELKLEGVLRGDEIGIFEEKRQRAYHQRAARKAAEDSSS